MELEPYIADLRRQLAVAAEAGHEGMGVAAERLMAPLEAATRLVLMEALSAAASEITRDLAPGSVDLRLRGRDPEFVVTLPPSAARFEQAPESTAESTPPARPALHDVDDGATSRLTLRLPEQLKLRVEEAAERDGFSVNAWLVRAIGAALDPKDRRAARRDTPDEGESYVGWVR